jgi:hypothetical protein
VTVYVSVDIPMGNKEPLGNPEVCAVTAPVQLSVPVGGVNVTIAPHWPTVLLTAISALQVITGSSRSVTVTVNEHEVVLPEASMA